MSDKLRDWIEEQERELVKAAKWLAGADGVNAEEMNMAFASVLELGKRLRRPSVYADEWREKESEASDGMEID